jgi:hypothetical protein
MFRIGGFLFFIVFVVTVVDIIKSDRDDEKKILWVVSVFLLPLIGSLAWFLVSRKIIKL